MTSNSVLHCSIKLKDLFENAVTFGCLNRIFGRGSLGKIVMKQQSLIIQLVIQLSTSVIFCSSSNYCNNRVCQYNDFMFKKESVNMTKKSIYLTRKAMFLWTANNILFAPSYFPDFTFIQQPYATIVWEIISDLSKIFWLKGMDLYLLCTTRL